MRTASNPITVQEVSFKDIQKDIKNFTVAIFNNFIELTRHPYVKHTKEEIRRLLESEQLFGYIVRYRNPENITKIIAYLFGETTTLPDGRNAYYLSYIYVSPNFQHKKLGSLLMKKIIYHCQHFGIPFIVLTCDTEDTKVMNFYKKLGFVSDPALATGKKHDVFCLYL